MDLVLNVYTVALMLEKDKNESSYSIVVPDVQGCGSVGETVNEALMNVKEALEGNLEALSANQLLSLNPKPLIIGPITRITKVGFSVSLKSM